MLTRVRVGSLIALVISVWGGTAPTNAAQSCPQPLGTISGVLSHDGSTPPGNPGLQYTNSLGAGGNVPSSWNSGAFCAGQAATYTFRAYSSGYFRTNAGSSTCSGSPLTCQGNYGATLHAQQGSIDGYVYGAASGRPLATTVSIWTPGGVSYNVGSNASGYFRVGPGPNNWGLQVYCNGDPTPPNAADCDTAGSATYYASADGKKTSMRVSVTSSVMSSIVLGKLEPNTEHSGRCNDPLDKTPGPSTSAAAGPAPAEPACPSCVVGAPIDLATGNVFFDQEDAAIPGIGTGLLFTRSYNSANLLTGQFSEAFGPGWSHSYDKRLFIPAGTTDIVAIRKGNGVAVYYQDTDHDNKFLQSYPWNDSAWIDKQGSTYVRRFRGGGSEAFDPQGRLVTVTDRNGNVTTLTYDATNRLATIAEPSGRSLTLHYEGQAFVQPDALLGPGNVILVSYGYTTGKLTSVTFPDSADDSDTLPDGGYTFEYAGPGGRLSTVRDLTGRIVEHHEYITASGPYYGFGRTSERTSGSEPDGVERYTVEYQELKAIVRSRRLAGAAEDETTYEFTSAWGQRKVARVTGPCASCGGSGGESRAWTYDSRGRVKTYTDAAGAVTSYSYDEVTGDLLAEMRSATGVMSQTTTYTYDSLGRLLTRSNPNGHVTTWTYATVAGPDTMKDKAEAEARSFRVTSYTYKPNGKTWTITDPRGKQTTFAYLATGDLQSLTDPLGHATSYEYDSLGRRTATINALGHRQEKAYNSRGLVVREREFRDGTAVDTLFAYDAGSRPLWRREPSLAQTDYAYDAYGRLTYVDGPLVRGVRPRTTHAYDLMSNTTSVTDAENHTTVTDYDGYNRVRAIMYPGGLSEAFTYDAAGRLLTRVDRKGVVTSHVYDAYGRLLSKTFSDGTPSAHYFYDESGDIGFRTRADLGGQRKLTWDYDLAGQLKQEQYWHDGSTLTSTVAYAYDAAGQRVSVALNGAPFTSYTYDDARRPSTITRGPSVFSLGYDAADRRASLSYPNLVSTSYSRDSVSNLLSIGVTRNATTIANFGYTYDDSGNRTSKSQLDYAETYEYDPMGRLTRAVRDGVTSESYGYDRVGNRLASLEHSDWTYNERNELQSYGPVQFSYDSNGNVTSKSEGGHTWAYEWQADNSLERVLWDGIEVARFRYDPLGRRVEKVTASGSTTYVYDGLDILRENRAGFVVSYVHGPRLDEPLSVEAGGQVRYIHADALGSDVKRTDQGGNVTFSRSYDAFGRMQQGASSAGHAFTGREFEVESGLYYYRARYYDATTGRFLSEDPIRGHSADSRYVYVENRPTSAVDPLGLQATEDRNACGHTAERDYVYCVLKRPNDMEHVRICEERKQIQLQQCAQEVAAVPDFGVCVMRSFQYGVPRPREIIDCACGEIPGYAEEHPWICSLSKCRL